MERKLRGDYKEVAYSIRTVKIVRRNIVKRDKTKGNEDFSR